MESSMYDFFLHTTQHTAQFARNGSKYQTRLIKRNMNALRNTKGHKIKMGINFHVNLPLIR